MIIYAFIFALGLITGSFLNVCIYRMPQGKSIVFPSSRCTTCSEHIRFYDNIPVLSFLLLGGKCRYCKSKLSLRYPVVELLNAVLYIAVLNRFGFDNSWALPVYFVFISSLIVIFFIDLDHQIIPDSITLPGIPVALILGSVVLPDPFLRVNLLGYQSSVIGCIAGGGSFYLIAVIGKAILKKEAMGGGDIKMMALMGGILGWKGIILTTFVGSLLGSIMGVALIAIKGREWGSKIPFGPYLATGAVISLLWGQDILDWYLYAW